MDEEMIALARTCVEAARLRRQGMAPTEIAAALGLAAARAAVSAARAGEAILGARDGESVPLGVLPPKRSVAGLTLEELDAHVARMRREVDAMGDGGDQVRRVGLLRDFLAAVREVAVRHGLLRRDGAADGER